MWLSRIENRIIGPIRNPSCLSMTRLCPKKAEPDDSRVVELVTLEDYECFVYVLAVGNAWSFLWWFKNKEEKKKAEKQDIILHIVNPCPCLTCVHGVTPVDSNVIR